MNQYKAIIFDLGNVVIKISPDNTFAYWAERSGIDVDVIKERFEFDDAYYQLERGEIESSTYRRYILEKLGLQISETEFDEGWNQIYLELSPGIEELLQDLKLKFRLFAFTNTNIIHAKEWKVRYASLLSNFEKVFCSHEIHARKPEKKAYEIILDYLKLNPKSVLFFDDNPENVKGALDAGLNGILVNSTEQIIHELNRLGIVYERS